MKNILRTKSRNEIPYNKWETLREKSISRISKIPMRKRRATDADSADKVKRLLTDQDNALLEAEQALLVKKQITLAREKKKDKSPKYKLHMEKPTEWIEKQEEMAERNLVLEHKLLEQSREVKSLQNRNKMLKIELENPSEWIEKQKEMSERNLVLEQKLLEQSLEVKSLQSRNQVLNIELEKNKESENALRKEISNLEDRLSHAKLEIPSPKEKTRTESEKLEKSFDDYMYKLSGRIFGGKIGSSKTQICYWYFQIITKLDKMNEVLQQSRMEHDYNTALIEVFMSILKFHAAPYGRFVDEFQERSHDYSFSIFVLEN